jgi:hypothetical protein
MPTLGHLRLQLRLKALGLTLGGGAAVLAALVPGQRVTAGVDLDLPVVSAVADHVLVPLDIQDKPTGARVGAREASKSSGPLDFGLASFLLSGGGRESNPPEQGRCSHRF